MTILLSTLACGSVRGATFVVTNTADSGAGSLRLAITSANASANVPDTHPLGQTLTTPNCVTPECGGRYAY